MADSFKSRFNKFEEKNDHMADSFKSRFNKFEEKNDQIH